MNWDRIEAAFHTYADIDWGKPSPRTQWFFFKDALLTELEEYESLEPFVCLFYSLLRDHDPMHVFTDVLVPLEKKKASGEISGKEFEYINKELEALARSLVKRFKELEE